MQLLGGIFGGLAHLIFGGGGKKVVPLPTATRDDAAAIVSRDDALRRRKAGLADMTNGTTGYEAGAGSVGRLVVGN